MYYIVLQKLYNHDVDFVNNDLLFGGELSEFNRTLGIISWIIYLDTCSKKFINPLFIYAISIFGTFDALHLKEDKTLSPNVPKTQLQPYFFGLL